MPAVQRSPEDRMQLNWRILLTRSEVLERLHRWLIQGDLDAELEVEVASSASKLSMALETVLDHHPGAANTPRLIRYPNPMKKKMQTSMPWFLKLQSIIELLVRLVGEGQNCHLRQAFYSTAIKIPGLNYQQFKTMVNDIAVSTHMHPTSLGIVAEEDGEIFIGPDLVMKVVRYEDLLRANKTHPPKPIPIPSNSPIPSRVMDIKFTRGAVRAVVVTEHQNLGTQLEAFRTEFADCLIVKTQGYPTLSAREFLHLLWQTVPASVPFLYFSDHDFQATQVFTVLKYGCLRNPWAIDIMCLPSLTWAGPTVEELYAHHKKYIFGVRIDDERSKDTHTPEHKLQHDAQEHWQKVKAKLDKLLSRSVTSKEASLYHNYFKRLDLMRTETVLSGQLDMMMEGKKFSIAALTHEQHCGLENFVINKVNTSTGFGAKPPAATATATVAVAVAARVAAAVAR